MPTIISRDRTWLILIGLALWYIVAAIILPITQDEAYYAQWGKSLAWGYFDHPPAVALMAYLSSFNTHPLLGGRLAAALLALVTAWLCARTYRLMNLDETNYERALIILASSLALLSVGALSTPDAAQVAAWAAAIHEAAYALTKNPRRWLSAGFVTGLGILSKYTFLLMGLVFLGTLLWTKSKQLRSKWPYLGGVVCLLVLVPHLNWNSQNSWITWRFQANHGLSSSHSNYLPHNALPSAYTLADDAPGRSIAQPFLDAEYEKPSPLQPPTPKWQKLLQRQGDFLGGALAFLGFHLLILLAGFFKQSRTSRRQSQREEPVVKSLLQWATWVPLLFFGSIALIGKVEANWSAMYILGAAPFLARIALPTRYLWISGALNLGILLLVIVHAAHPFLPIQAKRDRMLRDTHGYRDLATWSITQRQLVFADSYQIVSMLRWYGLEKIYQWPGITRPSHFAVSSKEIFDATRALSNLHKFMLITTKTVPPGLPGFHPVRMSRWTNCRNDQVVSQAHELDQIPTSCDPIHKWYMVFYERR